MIITSKAPFSRSGREKVSPRGLIVVSEISTSPLRDLCQSSPRSLPVVSEISTSPLRDLCQSSPSKGVVRSEQSGSRESERRALLLLSGARLCIVAMRYRLVATQQGSSCLVVVPGAVRYWRAIHVVGSLNPSSSLKMRNSPTSMMMPAGSYLSSITKP